MKLSFSVTSKSSASSKNPTKLPKSFAEESGKGSETKPQFITEFDPSAETLDRSSERVIAPLENTNQWRAAMRMKNLVPPTDVPDTAESTQFVVEQLGIEPSGTNTTYGLTLRLKGAGEEENSDSAPRPTEQWEEHMSEGQKFKVDIESLPEHGGIDEFNEVTVEDFSRALLRGYGWKEGQGIGKNRTQDVPIMDPKKWDGKSGLGFHADMPNSKKKSNAKDKEKARTPQEEKSHINEPKANGVDKRNVVRVISGKHAGSKGEILKKTGRAGMETIVLSLLGSGEAITVGSEMIAELGSPEEERCLRKSKKHGHHREDEKNEDKRNKKRSRDDEERSIRSDIKHGYGSSRGSYDVRESKTVCWLTSQIRVKVVSKDYKKGRFYLKKGVVTDVISPLLCDVSMDENRALLQGVEQEVLETVVPHCGGPVLVLCGKHKGVFGKLVEKDKEKETAMIRDADSHELIKVHMDQIAEYVGDPSDIGY